MYILTFHTRNVTITKKLHKLVLHVNGKSFFYTKVKNRVGYLCFASEHTEEKKCK